METDQPLVSFVGREGSYSHLACQQALSDHVPLPCKTFEEVFSALTQGRAARAVIPIENNRAGRVADIHQLLPQAELYVVGEHFQPIEHCLLGVSGADVRNLSIVRSHGHALAQCHGFLSELGAQGAVEADTATAAMLVAEGGRRDEAAIASGFAAQLYGLEVLAEGISDSAQNTTRFIVLARERLTPDPSEESLVTTILFKVRSVPAALYKALGGFATNGVNLSKIESYLLGDRFAVAQFYVDIEGHPEHESVRLALQELRFFSEWLKILGTYRSHPFRLQSEVGDP